MQIYCKQPWVAKHHTQRGDVFMKSLKKSVWSALRYTLLFMLKIKALTPGCHKLYNNVNSQNEMPPGRAPKTTHFTNLHSPNLHLQKTEPFFHDVLASTCDMWTQPLQL